MHAQRRSLVADGVALANRARMAGDPLVRRQIARQLRLVHKLRREVQAALQGWGFVTLS